MRNYQTVVIIKSGLDESQVDSASEKIKEYISKHSGAVLSLNSWGKKRLAYRVRKNRYGVYLNACHTLEPSKVTAFENELRLDETFLKYLVIRLEPSEVERACGEDNSSSNEGLQNKDGDGSEKASVKERG